MQCPSLLRRAVQVPIPREQVHAIQEGLSVREAATEYEGQLLRLPHDVLPRNAKGARAQRLSSCMGRQQCGCGADRDAFAPLLG